MELVMNNGVDINIVVCNQTPWDVANFSLVDNLMGSRLLKMWRSNVFRENNKIVDVQRSLKLIEVSVQTKFPVTCMPVVMYVFMSLHIPGL